MFSGKGGQQSLIFFVCIIELQTRPWQPLCVIFVSLQTKCCRRQKRITHSIHHQLCTWRCVDGMCRVMSVKYFFAAHPCLQSWGGELSEAWGRSLCSAQMYIRTFVQCPVNNNLHSNVQLYSAKCATLHTELCNVAQWAAQCTRWYHGAIVCTLLHTLVLTLGTLWCTL